MGIVLVSMVVAGASTSGQDVDVTMGTQALPARQVFNKGFTPE